MRENPKAVVRGSSDTPNVGKGSLGRLWEWNIRREPATQQEVIMSHFIVAVLCTHRLGTDRIAPTQEVSS